MIAVAHPLALCIGVALAAALLVAFVAWSAGWTVLARLVGMLAACLVFATGVTAFVTWAICGRVFGAC